MSARRKLNIAFFNGAILIATVAGIASRSAETFVVVLIVMLVANRYLGNFR